MFSVDAGFTWPKELDKKTYMGQPSNKKGELSEIIQLLSPLEERCKNLKPDWAKLTPPAALSSAKAEAWQDAAIKFFKSAEVSQFDKAIDDLALKLQAALKAKPGDKAKAALKSMSGVTAQYQECFKSAVYEGVIHDKAVAMVKAYRKQLLSQFKMHLTNFKTVASQPGDSLHDAKTLLAAWPAGQDKDDARSVAIGGHLSKIANRMYTQVGVMVKATQEGIPLTDLGVPASIIPKLPQMHAALRPLVKAPNLGTNRTRKQMTDLVKTVSDQFHEYEQMAMAFP